MKLLQIHIELLKACYRISKTTTAVEIAKVMFHRNTGKSKSVRNCSEIMILIVFQ